MSQITEFLKLLPKALPNADDIVRAIVTDVQYRQGTLSEDKKAELVRRRVICAVCPFMSKNAQKSQEYKELTGDFYQTKRNDPHCSFCGCPISKRTASFDSECGIESWNSDHPDKQIPLKWTKFDTDGRKQAD